METHKKVLLIGIDGADPRVLTQLMDEGKLPNFAKLRDEGTFTKLQTSMPPHSPVAWTTIATGTNPGKHNIFDFIARDPKTYLPSLALSKATTTHLGGAAYESIVTADPFWRTSTQDHIPTSVLRWPVTFPPEKVEGHLLSGLGVPDVRGLLSGYTYYTTEDVNTSTGPEKNIKVTLNNGIIETEISGPRKRQGDKLVDIKTALEISVADNKAILTVNNKQYQVAAGGWTEWIQIKFKTGFMSNVHGIAKAQLASVTPFKMYLTAVQIDPEHPLYKISYPDEYSAELAKQIGLYYTLGIAEDTGALNDKKIDDKAFIEQIWQLEEEREKMFWTEFRNFNSGVFAFVFDSSDRLQHMFWEENAFTKTLTIHPEIEKYYVKKDAFLGKVMQEMVDTKLIIVSDHGFSSFQRAVSVNRWLVDNGFMTLTEEPEDDGGLFANVDWSRTKAYALGFNSIYINLKGREGQGIVEDSDAVEKELIEKFSNLTDNGRKVIHKLYRSEDIYSGNQVPDGPDIMIGYNPGYRTSWQTAIGGLTKEIIFDNEKHWKADHLIDPSFVPGIFFANFKIQKENPEQKDIAPTVLSLIGADVPENMDGKILT
jgi:predicted AlkP superfamily phosphohydrolase/phosphomutase